MFLLCSRHPNNHQINFAFFALKKPESNNEVINLVTKTTELLTRISELKNRIKNITQDERNAKIAYDQIKAEKTILLKQIDEAMDSISKKFDILAVEVLDLCKKASLHEDTHLFPSNKCIILKHLISFLDDLYVLEDNGSNLSGPSLENLYSKIFCQFIAFERKLNDLEIKSENKGIIVPESLSSKRLEIGDLLNSIKQILSAALMFSNKSNCAFLIWKSYEAELDSLNSLTNQLNKLQQDLNRARYDIKLISYIYINLRSLFSRRNLISTLCTITIILFVFFMAYKAFNGNLDLKIFSKSEVNPINRNEFLLPTI